VLPLHEIFSDLEKDKTWPYVKEVSVNINGDFVGLNNALRNLYINGVGANAAANTFYYTYNAPETPVIRPIRLSDYINDH
jgi:hypothetical protein